MRVLVATPHNGKAGAKAGGERNEVNEARISWIKTLPQMGKSLNFSKSGPGAKSDQLRPFWDEVSSKMRSALGLGKEKIARCR